MASGRILFWFAAAHLAVAVVALIALAFAAPPIGGVHPALKPLKFAISIAVFLGTLALLVPVLSLSPTVRDVLAWIFALAMAGEMVAIAIQALRGTSSHYNFRPGLDATISMTMALLVVAATLAMIGVAIVATIRPLVDCDALRATAWRAGLWFFLLAAGTGFRMIGSMRHSVGGADGGPGLPVTSWSTAHGDLRVSHFIALHALQILPLASVAIAALPLGPAARWSVLLGVIVAYAAVAVGTLVQALAGRPLW